MSAIRIFLGLPHFDCYGHASYIVSQRQVYLINESESTEWQTLANFSNESQNMVSRICQKHNFEKYRKMNIVLVAHFQFFCPKNKILKAAQIRNTRTFYSFLQFLFENLLCMEFSFALKKYLKNLFQDLSIAT